MFWSGALLIGLFASFFSLVMDKAQALFDAWVRPHAWLPFVLAPLGFAVIRWVTLTYAPAARGAGIPQTIAARLQHMPQGMERLLGWRVMLVKILMLPLAILIGASVGREGPTVQIGAGIMFYCAMLGGMQRQQGVVLAGAAAGVAAAFNTPLAGVVFAIEEMARAFEHRNSTIVLIAIVVAGATAMSILGNYDYFGYTYANFSFGDVGAILTISLLGGLGGGLFSRCLTHGEPLLRRLGGQFGYRHPLLFAGLCGLGIAVLGFFSHGMSYGTGYEIGHALLHQDLVAVWWQAPAKFLATVLCAVSGIPGGFFAPSLSIGAALGANLAALFPATTYSGAVLLGMAAYFAGVTQAPITSFVIVLEITGEATSALPIMAAAIIATGISRLMNGHSLYHTLAKGFITEKQA